MYAKSALVVDDSKSARFALRRYLENRHYRVDAVGSAEEAFSFLAEHRPGVIFLDHIMPGTDGFAALRAIKADGELADIPVVICSSHEGAEFNAHARSAGARDVLQKPPDPQQLTRILETLQTRWPEAEPVAAVIAETDEWHFDLNAAPTEPAKVPPARLAVEAELDDFDAVDESAELPASIMQAAPGDSAIHQDALAPLMEQIAALRRSVAEMAAAVPAQQQRPQWAAQATASLSRVEQRLDEVQRELSSQIAKLGAQLEKALAAQSERIEQGLERLRQETAEESRLDAERIAETAVGRTVERLARTLLAAVQPSPGEQTPADEE